MLGIASEPPRGASRTYITRNGSAPPWMSEVGCAGSASSNTAFREHEIKEQVLPRLTQEDLKEIGVGPVGNRRILLEAIAALRADTSPSAEMAATSGATSISPEDRAERRPVTVMFPDLIGSTALSARLDPEDMREIISAHQGAVAEAVVRFRGFVANTWATGC